MRVGSVFCFARAFRPSYLYDTPEQPFCHDTFSHVAVLSRFLGFNALFPALLRGLAQNIQSKPVPHPRHRTPNRIRALQNNNVFLCFILPPPRRKGRLFDKSEVSCGRKSCVALGASRGGGIMKKKGSVPSEKENMIAGRFYAGAE